MAEFLNEPGLQPLARLGTERFVLEPFHYPEQHCVR
jgi:hypothetical protein